ncbi:hypothetical protein F8R89_32030 [Streptomyces sp. SS1-1]|nr:hypothetical protein F8R89_32030 [Streptomyces sp. SS1-1]
MDQDRGHGELLRRWAGSREVGRHSWCHTVAFSLCPGGGQNPLSHDRLLCGLHCRGHAHPTVMVALWCRQGRTPHGWGR